MGERIVFWLPPQVALPNYVGVLRRATVKDFFIHTWIEEFYFEVFGTIKTMGTLSQVAWASSSAQAERPAPPPCEGTSPLDPFLFVLWHETKPVGMGALHEGCRLNLIYVPQEFRGVGHGRTIVVALAKVVRSLGNIPVLHTDDSNQIAKNLYKSVGFLEGLPQE